MKICHFTGSFTLVDAILTLPPEVTEGALFATLFLLREEGGAGVEFVEGLMQKYQGKVYDTYGNWDDYCYGVQFAMELEGALKSAVAKVGYEKLNGQAMKEALETLELDVPFSMGVSFADYQGDRVAQKGFRMIEIQNNKPTPIIDFTPWYYVAQSYEPEWVSDDYKGAFRMQQ